MKKQIYAAFALSLVLGMTSCSKDETPDANGMGSAETVAISNDTISTTAINQKIFDHNATQGVYNWKQATPVELWSAVIAGHNLVSIGYGSHEKDVDRVAYENGPAFRTRILELVAKMEGKSVKDILIYESEDLNLMDVKIEKKATFEALLAAEGTRYIEPAAYEVYANKSQYQVNSSGGSGCGYNTSTLPAADYTTVTPNAKVPWNFYKHSIPSAWAQSTGAGVTIGVVDTGLSSEQTLMNGSFNSGASSGRSVVRYGVFVDSFWNSETVTDGINDLCGHGTSMSSIATAPRNNAGMPVGVAYNSSLIVFRAAKNVVLDSYHEQVGVETAFTRLANTTRVKIISMSMGHIFSVGRISDALIYAYGKGKMIFCAGGTSTSFTNFVGVIFPASMSEAIAVTGIKDSATFTECDVCHKGAKIDFTVVMERASNGNTVPTLSYYNGQANYVGGSSVATATSAGIAALVWAKNPTWTRAQVLAKMKASATYPTTRNANFGHGNVNVLKAVQ